MRKILIASHGRTASGIRSTVELFMGKQNITCIDAYLEGPEENFVQQIVSFIDGISDEDESYIFTDIFGGSVNQKVLAETWKNQKKNIIIITNVNVAVVIELLTNPEFKSISEINAMIKELDMMPQAVDPCKMFEKDEIVSDDVFLD